MRVRAVVKSSRNPADLAVPDQPGQSHADAPRITEIGEVMRREGPTPPHFPHSGKDLLIDRLGWRGAHHVENSALFLQQIKSPYRCLLAARRPS
jgi:hypothetical protein